MNMCGTLTPDGRAQTSSCAGLLRQVPGEPGVIQRAQAHHQPSAGRMRRTRASGIFSTKRSSPVSTSMLTRMLVPKPKKAFQSPATQRRRLCSLPPRPWASSLAGDGARRQRHAATTSPDVRDPAENAALRADHAQPDVVEFGKVRCAIVGDGDAAVAAIVGLADRRVTQTSVVTPQTSSVPDPHCGMRSPIRGVERPCPGLSIDRFAASKAPRMMSWPGSPRTRMRPIGPGAPMRFAGSPRSTFSAAHRIVAMTFACGRSSGRRQRAAMKHGRSARSRCAGATTSLPSAAPKTTGSKIALHVDGGRRGAPAIGGTAKKDRPGPSKSSLARWPAATNVMCRALRAEELHGLPGQRRRYRQIGQTNLVFYATRVTPSPAALRLRPR